MLTYTPHPYQRRALDWIKAKPACGLFLDMGLGKTVVTLTAIRELIDEAEVHRALVVAPKKVAETTWTDEAAKWAHLQGLRVSRVMGTPRQRTAALDAAADVYVIGRDSFVWLCKEMAERRRWPFDMVVLDELTSFKNPQAGRFKAFRRIRAYVRRVVGLTGTPAPNGLPDLWAQLWCLDMGDRLGKYVTHYRAKYFAEFKRNGITIRLTPRPGAEAQIREAIADICLPMSAADYLTMPPVTVHDVRVRMSDAAAVEYKIFERNAVLEVAGSTDAILASNAAALMGKLAQFANGAIYDQDHNAHEVHADKLDALAEIVEGAGESVLVFYQYRHDAERITARLKDRRVRRYEGPDDLRAWNAGEVDVLLAHPASTAYGLNMQQGGRYIVWFGTGWDLELYSQANARLHRQGQTKPVIIYRLITAGTVDERAVAALSGKQSTQAALMAGLKDLINLHTDGKG